ncbi:class I SAM-dependent methyltransferase [Caulobacter sp.]|uniref:class I SAM-dependent methyltransferase n=1 Tax=Caulobacter sp. TaxID=78 RepID=UPI003BAEBAD6
MPRSDRGFMVGGPARLYQGAMGDAYHAQRAQSRDEAVQAQRAIDFAGLSTEQDVVLDFGCGTGGILGTLPAARKIGVEINERAAQEAQTRLDAVHPALADVPANSVDVIISFHALEHVGHPLTELQEMRRVLKPKGRLRIIVPCETPLFHKPHRKWKPDDIDMHLYSWTPLTLGNLISVAGLQVVATDIVPMSSGGRLATMLKSSPRLAIAARWLKAIRAKSHATQLLITAIKAE